MAKPKTYICKHVGCNKVYATSSARAVHARKCTYPSPGTSSLMKATKHGELFKCRYCVREFKIRCSVYRHQRDCNDARILAGKLPKIKKKKITVFK